MLRNGDDNPTCNMTTSLEELYFDQIRDVYCAEIQVLRMLPQMASYASCAELADLFKGHTQDTHRHCARLCKISERHGISHLSVACESMHVLLREAARNLTETIPGKLRDGVLIAAANRIEHYEIGAYGVAKAFADCLGYREDSSLLEESLQEESEASAALTRIATGGEFLLGRNVPVSIA